MSDKGPVHVIEHLLDVPLEVAESLTILEEGAPVLNGYFGVVDWPGLTL